MESLLLFCVSFKYFMCICYKVIRKYRCYIFAHLSCVISCFVKGWKTGLLALIFWCPHCRNHFTVILQSTLEIDHLFIYCFCLPTPPLPHSFLVRPSLCVRTFQYFHVFFLCSSLCFPLLYLFMLQSAYFILMYLPNMNNFFSQVSSVCKSIFKIS